MKRKTFVNGVGLEMKSVFERDIGVISSKYWKNGSELGLRSSSLRKKASFFQSRR